MDFIYFVGRFHVLALHLPIGIILAVVVLEWLSRKPRYAHLRSGANFLWGAAAITALGTAALGYMHFAEGGFEGRSANAHRLLGTSVAVLTSAIWLTRLRLPRLYGQVGSVAGIVLVVLVFLTGHFGGNLTHGDTYLVEYAPNPIRSLFGAERSRKPPTDLASADPYLDVIQPLLAQRCSTCHNDDKQRGKLNVTHYDTLMKGGQDGPVIVAGKPDASDLYRRITLSADNKDFMPKEGKTPLTEAQVKIVGWWISSGALTGKAIGTLTVPKDIAPLLSAHLGLGGQQAAAAADTGTRPADARPLDLQLISSLASAGFEARPISDTDGRVVVNSLGFGAAISAQQLASLVSAQGSILELNLPHAAIDDAALTQIGKLSALTHLRLPRNAISDRGLASLISLANVSVLDLHDNPKITDDSLDTLAKLKSLKKVYLWNTRVSQQGVAKLRARRPDLLIQMGVDTPGQPNMSASAVVRQQQP